MQDITFSFPNQADPVQELLRQCTHVVTQLPPEKTGDLVAAMRAFETCTVPYHFDLDDMAESAEEFEADTGQQIRALSLFTKEASHSEDDENRLRDCLESIVEQEKAYPDESKATALAGIEIVYSQGRWSFEGSPTLYGDKGSAVQAAYRLIESKTKDYLDISGDFWNTLSKEQKLELIEEAHA